MRSKNPYSFQLSGEKHLQNYVSSTSSHLHLCTSTFSPISLLIFTSAHLHLCSSSSLHISTSLLMFICAHLHLCSSSHPHIISAHLHILTSTAHIFTLTFSLKAGGSAAGAPRNATLCGDRARRAHEMQARVRFVSVRRNPLRRSRVSSARNAGESAIWICPAQPSAEIARVEGAKCRRECDLKSVRRNRLRRSCVSSARNAGESTIGPGPGQPSAEIVRVERAKCRRECDLTRSGATLSVDRACRAPEMQGRARFASVRRNPLPRSRVSSARNAGERAIGELEDENWRLSSTTCMRSIWGAGRRELATL